MGNSADATLFYGLCWDEENFKPWAAEPVDDDDDDDEDADDWEEIFYSKLGIVRPSMDYDKNNPESMAVYPAFWDAQKKAKAAGGCDIGRHCNYDLSKPYVCIIESWKHTDWSKPLEVDLSTMQVKPEWNEKLRRFCEIMHIEWQEPKWWLVAFWG